MQITRIYKGYMATWKPDADGLFVAKNARRLNARFRRDLGEMLLAHFIEGVAPSCAWQASGRDIE
ncbi:hypothetical protein [Cupriavidus basilensis]|uniref:hypothetical protein n=1 Tax=Cupriavidus basilensis TaxID=68895 RepID=UPI001186C99D|nr:hypothetical protein [Cupriavidus basilensis]